MTSFAVPTFSVLFALALASTLVIRLWLAQRQIRHVHAHRDHVPSEFSERIELSAHQKAADYTVARTRLGMVETVVDTAVLLVLTFGGGVALLVHATGGLDMGVLWQDLALIVAIGLLTGILGLPFAYWHTFVLEARFGFNRTTLKLWLTDLVKGIVLGAVLGLPLAALALTLMRIAGPYWWLWVWAVWIGFQFLILALYPTVIAPLFNKFSPLPEGPARARIEALLARCGFKARGLFVMDGSKRSSHGNAFFTGFGRAKRIVFFDTLLQRLAPEEVEAVLAHELGHFRLKHVIKRMVWMAVISLLALAVLAWLMRSPWFYEGLAVPASMNRPGVALVLFFMVLPVFTFLLAPLSALYSRKHEFEADAFAAQQASASSLVHALVKLYQDNAATLTPDPVHSTFYDSHPPAAIRIARLQGMVAHHS
jgi:STE24 endopeptidase